MIHLWFIILKKSTEKVYDLYFFFNYILQNIYTQFL